MSDSEDHQTPLGNSSGKPPHKQLSIAVGKKSLEPDPEIGRVYAELDPSAPQKTRGNKIMGWLVAMVNTVMIFGFPFFESMWRDELEWGYTATQYGVPRFYGFVLIFSAILPTLVTQFYLAFGVVGSGRKTYGYKLPVMYASVDIHVLDVASGGNILSGGSVDKAQAALRRASLYSSHQRAHYNALESLPLFFALSLLGGIRYPLTTAFYGLYWCSARVIWTRGYTDASAKAPINRYNNVLANGIWIALFGVLANTIGLAIGLFN